MICDLRLLFFPGVNPVDRFAGLAVLGGVGIGNAKEGDY